MFISKLQFSALAALSVVVGCVLAPVETECKADPTVPSPPPDMCFYDGRFHCAVTAEDSDGDCATDADERKYCKVCPNDSCVRDPYVNPFNPDDGGDSKDSDCGGTDGKDPHDFPGGSGSSSGSSSSSTGGTSTSGTSTGGSTGGTSTSGTSTSASTSGGGSTGGTSTGGTSTSGTSTGTSTSGGTSSGGGVDIMPPLDTTRWFKEDHLGNGVMNIEPCRDTGLCEYPVLRCRSGYAGTEDWNMMCRTNVAIQDGSRYRFEFCAEASESREFTLEIRLGSGTYRSLGLIETPTVFTDHGCYAYEFTGTGNESQAQLTLQIGRSTTTFWFSQIHLYRL